MNSALFSRRWYDEKPELSRCIGLVEVFPPDIQTVIAQGMITLAENEFQARELMNSLKSLGPEIILGIYKSKNRRRTHDQHDLLHQAMNYFYILGADNQIKLSAQVTQVVRYIYLYLDTCKQHRRAPVLEDIAGIKNTFVYRGNEEAKNVTAHLTARIADGVTIRPEYKPPAPPVHKPPKQTEVISEGDSGMQIRKND